jgi:outer membrane protein insertion porin family
VTPPGAVRLGAGGVLAAFPIRVLHRLPLLAGLALGLAARSASAQQPAPPTTVVDSIVVEGNQRVPANQIQSNSGLTPGQTINYRDIQRGVTALFRTGQFDDVTVEQRNVQGKLILAIRVRERPLLEGWSVRGYERIEEGAVRDRVKLATGGPLDRDALERSRAAIDSLYKKQGYYAAEVSTETLEQPSGGVRVVFDIAEGRRVSVSQVVVEGNEAFPDGKVVKQMATRPEGFWWFRKGEYDERRVDEDMRDRLPRWYADRGYIDFQVTDDSLVPDSARGKATLHLSVEEGEPYSVGSFDIQGNRRFSSDELRTMYPFKPGKPFSRSEWETATENVSNAYANNGYIYARVEPVETRRTTADGKSVLDLGWAIREGSPATINKIEIVGNDVTHERVIREAIVLLPGSLFNRELLIRSYQNVSNLGYFQQPLPPPDVRPAENGVDVDIVFRVEEKRTGNINFGASLGQGTGVGGFLGLEEPNLFGRGKRGRLQWQFGANINDFTLSYTDPAIRESRVSGTLSLFDSRQRFIVGDLGRRRQTGGSVQIGFPFLGSRYTRLFMSYGLQRIKYSEGSSDLRQRFACASCTRSTLGASVVRDTRIGLPFATAGTYVNVGGELNGGVLGGTGNYRKLDLEGRWYAPLGTLGGGGQLGAGVQFVLGITAKSGFIFGDAGPFYTERYSLGGVQYGIPLRGYDEFSITPDGYDPNAGGGTASVNAFGESFAAFTVEAGARISGALYLNAFLDAGNVYRTARQYDPTRLLRGAGVGAAVVSPLGPLGIDIGYGFDKKDIFGAPAPGWQLHFRLGNFF